MSREVLKAREFVVLHDAILQKYAQECQDNNVPVPKKKAAKYGFGKQTDSDESILGRMRANPAIDAYLKKLNSGQVKNVTGYQEINGKNLYNKFLEAQNDVTTVIVLSEPYSVIYPLYIGCKDLDDFREKYHLKPVFDTYIGYYYSHQGSEVKSFTLQMAYAEGICEAELRNFHEGRRQDPFTGTGKVKSNNLFINLENEEEVELKLVIPLEGNQFQAQPYLLGVLTTITSGNFPISVRFFLIRTPTESAAVVELDEYKIKRYLNLQRQILRAPNERIYRLQDLSVRGEYVEELVEMIGTYWIWRYVEDDIVQIKLVIGADLTVQVFDPFYSIRYSQQIGRLNASRHFHHNLCISTFPAKEGIAQQILSYYLVEMPQGSDIEGKYLQGIYCNVGNGKHTFSGGSIAIYREQTDALEVEAQIIRSDKIPDYLDKYPELVPLKTMLDIQTGKKVK